MALNDTPQENPGGVSFLHAGCMDRGQGSWGSVREGLYLTVRSQRTHQLLLGGRMPGVFLCLCSCVGLTLNPQSEALFSPLFCQILTPTQEKGSTFCQMLWPLPLQKAPANLSLCRMRGPTPAAGLPAHWAAGSCLLLGLGLASSGAGPSLGHGGLSLIRIWTLEPDLAGAPPTAQPLRGFLSHLSAHSLHTASHPSVSLPVCSSP